MPRKKKIVEETPVVEEVKVVELPKVVSEEEITIYVSELLQTKSDADLKTFTKLVKEHFMNREVDVKIIAKLAGRILHKNKIQKTSQSSESETKEDLIYNEANIENHNKNVNKINKILILASIPEFLAKYLHIILFSFLRINR